jgi:hypothetical protein
MISGEMDFTMLRQMCRRGRLSGITQDYIHSNTLFGEALKILFPDAVGDPVAIQYSDTEMAQHNSKGMMLAPEIYNEIFKLVNSESSRPVFRHYYNLPHPPNALVLPPLTISLQKFEHDGRRYTSFLSHPGNSSISFHCANGDIDTGFIMSIWSQVIQGMNRIFIVVAPHTYLSAHDEVQSPYSSQTGFLGTVVYSQPTYARSQVLIRQNQIRGHIAFYDRPLGTFGIKVGVRVLIDSLRRN